MLGGMNMGIAPDNASQRETPGVIVRLLDNPVTLFVARVWITSPFVASGLMKLLDWQAGDAEMSHFGLHPAWAFNMATVVCQLGGSTLIILNRWVWVGAGALGVFTVLSTLLAHRFWDFAGDARVMQLNSFFEHWTISAAFILVAVVGFRERARCSLKGMTG
jgi:transmembrane protein